MSEWQRERESERPRRWFHMHDKSMSFGQHTRERRFESLRRWLLVAAVVIATGTDTAEVAYDIHHAHFPHAPALGVAGGGGGGRMGGGSRRVVVVVEAEMAMVAKTLYPTLEVFDRGFLFHRFEWITTLGLYGLCRPNIFLFVRLAFARCFSSSVEYNLFDKLSDW